VDFLCLELQGNGKVSRKCITQMAPYPPDSIFNLFSFLT